MRKNLYNLLDIADKIIYLDIPLKIRKRRILYRYIKQRLGLEKCNYMPNMKMLKNMYKWTSEFESNKINFEKDLFRYEEKLTILQSKGKIKKYVNGDGSI